MGVPHLVVQVSTKRVDAEDEEGDAGVADDLHVPHLDEALEGVSGGKEVGERERRVERRGGGRNEYTMSIPIGITRTL